MHWSVRALAVATVATTLGVAANAHAATVILNSGQPYDEVVHANSAGSGNTLNTLTKPGGYKVNLFSANGLDVGNGNGVAIVKGLGSGNGNGFSSLTIDPLVGFSVMQFKIEDFGGKIKGYDFDILVNFVGGGSQPISDYLLPNNSKIDVLAGAGEVMDSIILSGLRDKDGNSLLFKDIKQISFDIVQDGGGTGGGGGGVPEPATWSMMILGLGLAGAAMRRKQQLSVRFA